MIGVGILGAGGIAERAMVEPARTVDGVEVVRIGARDPERARAFAERLDLPAWGDYDAVFSDPRVDLVYLALPPIVHAEWATRALEAGKHVLCEKPLSANGTTAAAIADTADASGRRAFVGFHYRLHPFIAELLATIGSGILGDIQRVAVDFSIPHFVVKPGNIRLDGDLAGGAVMDVGCYAVDLLRAAWGEPEVVAASARTYDADPRIDLQTDADLRLPGGVPASVRASFLGDDAGAMEVRVDGRAASLVATSVIVPQWGATLTVTSPDGAVVRELAVDPAENSYSRQLEHLRDVLSTGADSILDARRAVGTMRAVDAIYRAAGLQPR
ncbi:Gfo/Idh/MocA family protein [Microbacterium testaceum]|uniref:Gfo/Idh/MocA family protein n=1 Tax=Microbacterium testaceum TaxID=2033 RepID=UPI001D170EBF|nr:Gfo/Idh/MocA family oxidoreductase [Microbacterium testaceum]MCC4247747.1 Gfo/Idh/MocA family oxidoreductase [Microbacterium testaceum]